MKNLSTNLVKVMFINLSVSSLNTATSKVIYLKVMRILLITDILLSITILQPMVSLQLELQLLTMVVLIRSISLTMVANIMRHLQLLFLVMDPMQLLLHS